MTEVFQFAMEEKGVEVGGGQRKSRGSRTRDGEKLSDDMATNPSLDKMYSLSQMCLHLKAT